MSAIIIVGIILFLLAAFSDITRLSGRSESMDFNRRFGQWRVRYPDGAISQPFCRDVADDYAKLFGGEVIPRDRK